MAETEQSQSREKTRKEPKNYSWASLLRGEAETNEESRRTKLYNSTWSIARRLTRKFVNDNSTKRRYIRKRTRWNESLMIPGSTKYSKLERDLGMFALEDSGRRYL